MYDFAIDVTQVTAQEMIPLVNEAFKGSQSVLTLARSPLANSRIVQPALVHDDVSPTAEERGRGLFLALRWAVHRLAPGAVRYPFGDYRPLDDPTWRDPRWWRYNILRHRYLDLLHPDDFVEGGRYTETLLALTGIPTTDSFFDERNRAIREVAHWLHRQLQNGDADMDLQRLALQEAYAPLAAEPQAVHLMEIAATFTDIFPEALLLMLAEAEGVLAAPRVLDGLIRRRYLLSEAGGLTAQMAAGASLWMSPPLRHYVYSRAATTPRNSASAAHGASNIRTRHVRIARALAKQGQSFGDSATDFTTNFITDSARNRSGNGAGGTDSRSPDVAPWYLQRHVLIAARHYRLGGRPEQAAQLLLAGGARLIDELDVAELLAELSALPLKQLTDDSAYQVLIQCADLQRMTGDHDSAVATCRTALRNATDARRQGEIYRRLAKLYEQRNQSHAINYYRQAIAHFEPTDPAMAELLKDRGWLQLLRRDWAAAEADLLQALTLVGPQEELLRADIYDALSSLRRRQQQHGAAVDYAQRALTTREAIGDPLRIAKSLGNLGLIYNDQGDYAGAIAAFEEAAVTYRRLGNSEFTLTALLNVGLAHHLSGQLEAAIDAYLACLELGGEIGHHLSLVTAYSNLAEAYAEQGQDEAARTAWQAGYQLSRQHGFDDEINYYVELRQKFAALADLEIEPAPADEAAVRVTAAAPGPTFAFMPNDLDLDERAAVELAYEQGHITAKALMEAASVSKPTATRKLAALVERGLLEKHGQGRSTYYAPVTDFPGTQTADAVQAGQAMPSIACLSQKLQSIRAELRQQHGVVALAIAEEQVAPALHGAGLLPGVVNLIVRFQPLPDLLVFCALEQSLAQQCRAPIKLVPAAALQGVDEEDLLWLWA